jgi:hypothetical protein
MGGREEALSNEEIPKVPTTQKSKLLELKI